MTQNPVAESVSVDDLIEVFCGDILAGKPDEARAEILSDVKRDMQALCDRNRHLIVDDASAKYLVISAAVLASYRALSSSGQGDFIEKMRGQISRYFRTGIRVYIKSRFDVDYDRPEEAYGKVTDNFIPRGEKFLGDAFTYGEESSTGEKTIYSVSKCFFLDFFRQNGAPEVTKVMCALDTVWADEFNEGAYNLRFSRPTLMSDGADMCRFRFDKVEK